MFINGLARCRLRLGVWILIGGILGGPTALAAPSAQVLDRIAAVVNDTVITARDLEQAVGQLEARLRDADRDQMPPTRRLRQAALENLIRRELQLQAAERLGIEVDDLTVSREIESAARQQDMSTDAFLQALQQDGLGHREVKEQLIIQKLRQQRIEERVNVSEPEIQSLLDQWRREQAGSREYRCGHVLVELPMRASPDTIAAGREQARQIRAALQARDAFDALLIESGGLGTDGRFPVRADTLDWRTDEELPTAFTEVVPTLEPGKVSEPLRTPSGFHVVRLLEVRTPETTDHQVEQARVRHILVQGQPGGGGRSARRRLETLRNRIQGGSDFAALARAHSEDPSSASAGGALGWVSGERLPARFQEAVARLEPGELSQPVQTQAGWHLIQVVDRRVEVDTEAYQRRRAERILRQRRADEEWELWLRQLRDESYVDIRVEGLDERSS